VNYELSTRYGKIQIDTRYGGAAGVYITWRWLINEVGDRPGLYQWQVLANNRPIPGASGYQIKDDALHSTIPAIDQGTVQFTTGDVIHVDASLLPLANPDILYVTPENECVVP
jgi:hypothetical protein